LPTTSVFTKDYPITKLQYNLKTNHPLDKAGTDPIRFPGNHFPCIPSVILRVSFDSCSMILRLLFDSPSGLVRVSCGVKALTEQKRAL